MLKKLKLFCLFVAVFFSNAPLAECPTNVNLTDSVFNVFYGDKKEPVGVAFLIDDTNKLFLTAKHVIDDQLPIDDIDDQLLIDDQRTSSLPKKFRLIDKNGQEIDVKVILEGYAAGTATFKGLMGDWALLKGQKSNADWKIPTPLQPHIGPVTDELLKNSNVYQNRSILDINKLDYWSDVQSKELELCSRHELRMLKIPDYVKGHSGSPVITRDCTVAALTSSFSDGSEFSDEEQKFLADTFIVLGEQLKKLRENSSTSSSIIIISGIIYEYLNSQQIVKVVPVVCIMREIIEARYNNSIDSIAKFKSDSRKLEKLLKVINASLDTRNIRDITTVLSKISYSAGLTWTDLVELDRALYHQNEMSLEVTDLFREVLDGKEKEIHSGYIGILSRSVSRNIKKNQSNTIARYNRIIEARHNNIPTFESNSQRLKLLEAINASSAINNDSEGLTWTDFMELDRVLSYHQNKIPAGTADLLNLVSRDIENQSNTITSISANPSLSSVKDVAETLVSNANNTQITTQTLPQIMPAESKNFGKDLSLEDRIKLSKEMENYLTGKIPWPAKVTPDFKRLVADIALSYAASAYLSAKDLKDRWYDARHLVANDLKDQSIVADSLKIIGTVINYGSRKEVLGEERYRQGKDVGTIIYEKGLEARPLDFPDLLKLIDGDE